MQISPYDIRLCDKQNVFEMFPSCPHGDYLPRVTFFFVVRVLEGAACRLMALKLVCVPNIDETKPHQNKSKLLSRVN